jgi:hypothetical protein
MKSALSSVPVMLVGVVGFGLSACAFITLSGYVLAGGWLVTLFGYVAGALAVACLLYAIAGLIFGTSPAAWDAWVEFCREQEARELRRL